MNHDSPSDGIEQEWVAERVAAWLAPAGCTSRWVAEPDGPARSMVVTLPGDGGPMVALLGHTDTVFPVGTAAQRPFRRDGDRCFGPGVADMKGGVLLAAAAVERLAAAPSRPFSEVRLLVCADEETRLRAPAVCAEAGGSRRRARLRVRARERRHGVGAQGRDLADAPAARPPGPRRAPTPHRGRSAVSALAREILRIEALTAGRPEMTSVITTVRGGDSANTVPGEAQATIDIRSSVPEDLVFALAELERDGAVRRRHRRDRGPRHLAADAANRVARRARPVAGRAIWASTIGEQHSGGVSDGCWTGDDGIPTLDGLGPVGGADHTPDEWIEIETLEARIELAARLVEAVAQRGA